jgi:hypothetical protein
LVQTFFERSFAINRLRQGPLAGHIDLLAARLAIHGYSRVHSRIQLRLVGHFNRWLEQKDLTVEQIDEEIIERYWRYFMRKKRVRSKDVCALTKLLNLLREQGPPPAHHRSSSDRARDTPREVPLLPARGARPGPWVSPQYVAVRRSFSGAEVSTGPF